VPKTHDDIILELENRLRRALIGPSVDELRLLFDTDIVYCNEFGRTFRGIENVPANRGSYRLLSIEVLAREITFFNSVVVSSTLEIRNGHSDGFDFITKTNLTRVWKFDGRRWKLICATAVSC
jgi:hypothetical protein